jgi:hypothetical protein
MAHEKWTEEYLSIKVPDVRIKKFSRRPFKRYYTYSKYDTYMYGDQINEVWGNINASETDNYQFHFITMKDFFDGVNNGGEEDEISILNDQVPFVLLNDISPRKDIIEIQEENSQENYFSEVNLHIEKSTFKKSLQYEPYINYFALIKGNVRFRVYPPSQSSIFQFYPHFHPHKYHVRTGENMEYLKINSSSKPLCKKFYLITRIFLFLSYINKFYFDFLHYKIMKEF